MRPAKATVQEIDTFLMACPLWCVKDQKLHREYVFRDFACAFAFMTEVAAVAEQMDHHPEWCNVYQRVTVDLVTHDAKGITELDFELARQMERLFSVKGLISQQSAK